MREFVLKRGNQLHHVFFLDIPIKIQIEIILKIAAANGSGFDFGEVQAGEGKALQHAVKGSRGIGQ